MLTFRRRKRGEKKASLFGGAFGFFGGDSAGRKRPKYKHAQTIGRFNLLRFNVKDGDGDNGG